jgi:hypothetical protein
MGIVAKMVERRRELTAELEASLSNRELEELRWLNHFLDSDAELATEGDFIEPFAKSLEDQAEEMTSAKEAFKEHPAVYAGMGMCVRWLQLTADAIRGMA